MKGGDCYRAAGRFVLDHPEAVLVHAVCRPLVGPYKGADFSHAWAEMDGKVYDYSNGKRIEVSTDVYRVLAQVRVEHRYTMAEVCRLSVGTGHWGPWKG